MRASDLTFSRLRHKIRFSCLRQLTHLVNNFSITFHEHFQAQTATLPAKNMYIKFLSSYEISKPKPSPTTTCHEGPNFLSSCKIVKNGVKKWAVPGIFLIYFRLFKLTSQCDRISQPPFKLKNGWLNFEHRLMYKKYTAPLPSMGCGVVERHLEMAQPTKKLTSQLVHK